MPRKTALEVQAIARSGAEISIDGIRFTSLELQAIARAAAEGNVKLRVRNADRFTSLELQAVGRAAPGRVILELDN